ncbi:class I SAM-dependent methyltransferase [Kiloniella laminariae]|uniref:Class I SAM-dependent methyltransferase n=1 Tax=Kiloniella laminariae TaxID=454162 RepID=A0ABT4LK76_9PROT|nr:class I SAM-dependent methyltransferase [Kiloniella laminariae]MCZ4281512.1 class I SAM-dependent methyltransferase [Kiloniella laminariae]
MKSRHLPISAQLQDYLIEQGVREDDLLRRLRAETLAMRFGHMQVSPEQGQFLAFLIKILRVRTVLEIGVFTGYSSLCMARALDDDGSLLGLDNQKRFTDIAQQYWAEAGQEEKIELRLCDALAELDRLQKKGATFDMIFLDADKERYPSYYDACLEVLNPGGLLVIDNVLWYGHVANATTTEPITCAIQQLNQTIVSDSRVEMVMLPFADGMTLVRKP